MVASFYFRVFAWCVSIVAHYNESVKHEKTHFYEFYDTHKQNNRTPCLFGQDAQYGRGEHFVLVMNLLIEVSSRVL